MTPNWDSLLDEASLASVLPGEFSQFVRPVREGLSLFLTGLPESQQASILVVQVALPANTAFSQRLGVLARSSPILQKLGQILARDQRLPLELRTHLRELESLPPRVPLEIIQEALTRELGPLDRRGITLEPPAIAEASVAVVIPFRQHATATGDPEIHGVFKVLKPGIEQQLEDELSLLERVGQHLDSRCVELQIPHLDYEESFQQVHEKLLDEVQLENEQRHLEKAKAFFAGEPCVRIPRLLNHCTPRVTAMERLSGDKVTSHGLNTSRRKRRLAKLIAKALIARPVFSTAEQSLFHGDPHAGNVFLTDDGQLGILDWSLAGTLGATARVAIVQMFLAAITLDIDRLVSVLASLGDRERTDNEALRAVAEASIKSVRRGQFPGMSWLIELLDEATQTAKLRVSPDLMLFRKSLLTLEGVIAEVGEREGQIEKTLLIEFLRHFAVEWPQRWLRVPGSREFPTRLSNFDLTDTLLSYPATVTRFWTGHAFDLVESCVKRWEAKVCSDLSHANNTMPDNCEAVVTIPQE